MISKPILLTVFFFVFASVITQAVAQAQKPKCCDNANCSAMASELALRISGITILLGDCDDDDVNDDSPDGPAATALKNLQTTRPELYARLINAVDLVDKYFFSDNSKYGDIPCFRDALPGDPARSITLCWINYIRLNVLKILPKFPSTEFCRGWSRRLELNQGSSAFLSGSSMAYLGSLRGYISYTFKKKDSLKSKQCGGRFRLSAGPGLFLRQNNFYLNLGTRASIRITDLKSSVFSLGNLNFFAGYNTNFRRFNYVESGFEAEIGRIGINLSANINTRSGKAGFLVGVVFANKKF